MHVNYLRDIPLGLGLLALLLAAFTKGFEIKCDANSPQWFCRAMLLVLGILLVSFSFIGQLAPQ